MLSKHDWSHAGYDAEELYFEKLNRELIEQLKLEMAAKKTEAADERPMAEVIPFPKKVRNDSEEVKKAA